MDAIEPAITEQEQIEITVYLADELKPNQKIVEVVICSPLGEVEYYRFGRKDLLP